MCPNSQDPSRLTATSVMSYKAVTASKPKQLPEAPRKGTAYRATKKLDKNNNDWHINNEHYNITHKFNQFTNNSTLITHNNTHHLTNTTHTTTNTNINTTKDIKDITVIEGEGANTKETPFRGTLGPNTVTEDKDFSVYSFNSNYSVTWSGPTNSTTVVPNTTTNSTNGSTVVPGSSTNEGTVGPSTVTEGKGANSMPMECTNSSINTKDFGDTIKEQNMYMNIRDHAVLTEEELATFRTSFCTKHHQNKCPNSDSCEKSHCLTWQRRNPYEISYCPHLCPNIQFVKKSRKMVLYRRCTRGKNCNFAHSKEEELYHPLVYKTKQCSSYPKCSRYFCPFIHEPHELRDISRFKNSSVTVSGTTATCSTMTGTTGPTDTIPPPKVTTTPGKGANFTGTECTGSTKEAPFGAATLGTTGAVGPSTVTEEEKEKVEMIETSFEFDCLDTINGQDTFRDGFTNNSFESNSTKDNLDHLIKSPNKSNIWDKNEEMENVMWYDLPNLNMNVYDDSLKPLYEPFNSYYSSINPYNTTINPYNTTINPYINIPNTIPNNIIPNNMNNMNIGMDIGYTYENYHDEQYYTNYPNLSSTINNKNKKKISSSVTVTGPPNSNGPDSNSSTRVTGNSSNDSKDTNTLGSTTVTKITTNKGIKGTKDINTKDTTNIKNTKGSSNDSSPKGAVGASTVTDTVTEENYYSYDYYKSYNNYQLKEFPDYKPYTDDYKGYTEDYKGYTEEYKPYADDYKGYTDEYKGYREEYGFVDNMGFVDNIGFVEDYKGYYDYETYQMNPMDPVNSMNQMDPVNSMNQMDTNYQMDSNYSMNQMNPMESNYSNNYSYDFGTDYVQYNTQELDEQFNNLNVKDDYSFNDMLVKFINEIGDK